MVVKSVFKVLAILWWMHLFMCIYICIHKHFCMKTYLWTCMYVMHQIVMTLYFVVVRNRSHMCAITIWNVTVQKYVSMQKYLYIYINKCIQHSMADLNNYILTLNTDFTTKTSKRLLLSLIFHCSDSPPWVTGAFSTVIN